jgi:hypothetical protein
MTAMLFELWAITAVVLGGTKLTGGKGSIIGTLRRRHRDPAAAQGAGPYRRGHRNGEPRHRPILIAVLFLDRQLNRKGAEELKDMTETNRPRPAPGRHRQDLPRRARARRRRASRPARRGSRPDGRERRRQVHADEGARRHLPARRGPHHRRREAGHEGSRWRPRPTASCSSTRNSASPQELSVAENIYLGELPKELRPRGLADALRRTHEILEKLKVGFNARTLVGDLSIANQQMVEIARALTVTPRR